MAEDTPLEWFIVEAVDVTYHNTPDEGENEYRAGVPIVAGPFDTRDEAVAELNKSSIKYHDGQMAVALRECVVPNDYGE